MFNCSYEGAIVVEGERSGDDGILGFMTRLSTINTYGLYLRDNHSIVISDFYMEQADNGFLLEGKPGQPQGQVTIQGAKVDFKTVKGVTLDIRNYKGEVFFGPDQFYASLPRVLILHSGNRPLDLFLWGNCFYRTHLEVKSAPTLNLHLLGNEPVAVEDAAFLHMLRDNMSASKLQRLSVALDDLRRLGKFDLELNH